MNIALIGYGKMGREIEKVLVSRGHTVVLKIDVDNAHDFTAEKMKAADAAIEFTTPATAYGNIMKCLEYGVPVVCGTTAWLDKYDAVVEECRKRSGTFFYASNYSIGVNIFFNINRRLAAMMERFGEYDVTIEEVHHTQKKDAPSGTAVTLAEGVLDGVSRKNKWVCGTTTEPSELEVAAIRRSIVPGTHTVTWESEVDLISITHQAKSRAGFAVGAVLAAEFIAGKKGVYSMGDLLGL